MKLSTFVPPVLSAALNLLLSLALGCHSETPLTFPLNSIVNVVFFISPLQISLQRSGGIRFLTSALLNPLFLSAYGGGVCFTWSNLHRSHCQSGRLLRSVNKDRIVCRLSHSQSLFWCKFGRERGLAPHCQGGKGVRKKIRSPEFLLFPSYHKTTQWNGLWKTYGGFGRNTMEKGLGMKQNFVYGTSTSCSNLCAYKRAYKPHSLKLHQWALKMIQSEVSSVYQENNELLTKCNLAKRLSKDKFRKL